MAEAEGPHRQSTNSFGEELRKEREIRGISVEEIAAATKIRKGFLEALERNEFGALPAPAFTRGFVRAYARYLGLNPEEMVDRYIFFERSAREGINEMPTPLISNDSAALQKLRESRDRTRRTSIALIVVGVLAVAAAVIWFFMFRSHKSTQPSARAGVPAVSPAPEMAPSTTTSTPAPSVSPAGSQAQAAASTAPMTLTLKAIENTWVDLQSDGRPVLTGEVTAGETKTFQAANDFKFATIGNAGGLTLSLNGRQLLPLGRRGDVVHDRTFDRTSVLTLVPATGAR